jgi:hypothetical protein
MALFQLWNNDPLVDQLALRRFLANELYGVDATHLLVNPNQPGANQANPMQFAQAAQMMGQRGGGAAGGGARPTPVQNLVPGPGRR